MISLWPCRTGVLVNGRTAHFAAGLLPWHVSYLCAVDAGTGATEGPGHYVRELAAWPSLPTPQQEKQLQGKAGLTPESAMVLSGDRLLVPQGRVAPCLHNRLDGEPVGTAASAGGCFAMLMDNNHWLSAPGNRQGFLIESDAKTGASPGLIFGGTAAVTDRDNLYYLTATGVTAIRRGQWAVRGRGMRNPPSKWTAPQTEPVAIIRAGTTILVGSRNKVVALAASDGKPLWQADVQGKAYELAVADGRLLVSTDAGCVYCFAAEGAAPTARPAPTVQVPAPGGKTALALGPRLRFTATDSAVVCWQTSEPLPTEAFWTDGRGVQKVLDPTPSTQHRAVLTGLKPNAVYTYTILAGSGAYLRQECDTYFNHSLTAPLGGPWPSRSWPCMKRPPKRSSPRVKPPAAYAWCWGAIGANSPTNWPSAATSAFSAWKPTRSSSTHRGGRCARRASTGLASPSITSRLCKNCPSWETSPT